MPPSILVPARAECGLSVTSSPEGMDQRPDGALCPFCLSGEPLQVGPGEGVINPFTPACPILEGCDLGQLDPSSREVSSILLATSGPYHSLGDKNVVLP